MTNQEIGLVKFTSSKVLEFWDRARAGTTIMWKGAKGHWIPAEVVERRGMSLRVKDRDTQEVGEIAIEQVVALRIRVSGSNEEWEIKPDQDAHFMEAARSEPRQVDL
jgi:hypothetical protein